MRIARSLGRDLPISIGLLAGFLHGVVNTVRGSGEVYFDSVTALIFLLLAALATSEIGRPTREIDRTAGRCFF